MTNASETVLHLWRAIASRDWEAVKTVVSDDWHLHGHAVGAAAADTVTENVLRLFGLPADEAQEICRRSLPDLASFQLPDSAA